MWDKVKTFFSEVGVELRKVSWPSRQQTISSTGVVVVMVLIIAFFLWIVDTALAKIVGLIIG